MGNGRSRMRSHARSEIVIQPKLPPSPIALPRSVTLPADLDKNVSSDDVKRYVLIGSVMVPGNSIADPYDIDTFTGLINKAAKYDAIGGKTRAFAAILIMHACISRTPSRRSVIELPREIDGLEMVGTEKSHMERWADVMSDHMAHGRGKNLRVSWLVEVRVRRTAMPSAVVISADADAITKFILDSLKWPKDNVRISTDKSLKEFPTAVLVQGGDAGFVGIEVCADRDVYTFQMMYKDMLIISESIR